MPKRDPDLLVEDMLGAIRKIARFTAGMDEEVFRQDERTVDAVVRNLEILGEATKQLPEDFVARYPDVAWRQIAGLRNRIVHDYFGLHLEIIWPVRRHALPPLPGHWGA